MVSMADRFAEEAEVAGLTTPNPIRLPILHSAAMRGSASARPPATGFTHRSRGWSTRFGWMRWSGLRPRPKRSKTAATQVSLIGLEEDHARPAVILTDRHGCGVGSASTSVPARPISAVASSTLFK